MVKIDQFISEQERLELLAWANSNRTRLSPNGASPGRYFQQISCLSYNRLVQIIKGRVMQEFELEHFDPFFTDFLSFNEEGAAIHPHKDPVASGFTQHVRINIVIQRPDAGGDSVQDGEVLELKNGMAFQIVASEVMHSSTPVVGKNPRITLSFGFQTKKELV